MSAVAVPRRELVEGVPRLDVERLFVPFLAPARAIQQHRQLLELAHRASPLPIDDPDAFRGRALRRIADMPPAEELRELRRMFLDAVRTPAKPSVVRVLLGAMLDGLRSKPADGTAAYIDLLVMMLADDFEDFDEPQYVQHRGSAPVIAWAVRKVLREERFPPDVSAFLTLCRAIEDKFRSAASAARKLIDLRENAEEILFWTADVVVDEGSAF